MASMIQLEDKLISGDLASEMFACDLSRCKGACCVEGDLGAPLEEDELAVLAEIYPKVKPFLREEGIRAIEEQGTSLRDFTDGYSTPLVQGRECAYAIFDEKGVALCGIEAAYEAGEVGFRKPISCHLYPIRITQTRKFEALNYDRWHICSPACSRGQAEGIKVYEFLREALIRKYGEEFYENLAALIEAQAAQD